MTTPERYVAGRGDAGLPKRPSRTRPILQPEQFLPPAATPASTEDRDHMAAKKKPKRYSPEEKAAIMARVAESSAAQVSRETGITEGTISFWKKKAKASTPKAAKKVAKRAAPATNGHADPTPDDLPTLQLKGLRAWVSRAVRDELAPVRKQLQSLVDAMGKVP